MDKKEKKSRKSFEDDGSHLRRSTRVRTRQVTEKQSPSERRLLVEKVPEKVPATCSDETLNFLTCNAVDLTSAPDVRSQRMNRSLEENLLAFLDGSANADPDEILEDKMMFLEATHSICVVPSLAHVPTPKMCQAVLQFIQESNSVGLTMSSFELLTDIKKRHPRVVTTGVTNPDSGRKSVELIVDEKVWSPLEETCKELASPGRQPVTDFTTEVPSNIFALVEAIARRLRRTEKPSTKKADWYAPEWGKDYIVALSQFMMSQHLMSLIQTDLQCRLKVFDSLNEKDFTVVQESYMYRLISCLSQAEKKGLLMNLNSIMDPDNLEKDVMDEDLSCQSSDLLATPPNHYQGSETAALQATSTDFGRLASDLLVLIMKIDTLNQEFGVPTSLARRGSRILFDTLLSICTKASILDAYLKAVPDPSAKVRFVMDYFVNFAPKPVAQDLVDCSIMESVDKLIACFTDLKTLKAVVKVFKETCTLPLLISHVFQAFLLLHSLDEDQSDELIRKSLQESRARVCKSIVIAFHNLKTIERVDDMLPIAEQTLFVASRISVS